ncbi:hypothetical protein [Gordonia humi]|uniref:Uncharacterized protein n=1 Tax=Gordonia humi TaxID=686429 RepID=A0A840F4U0_9ACTN|nr:hypothetical protein [Gordonia humi]MBB4137458.1 hypothetical protein [Gordonia humi]
MPGYGLRKATLGIALLTAAAPFALGGCAILTEDSSPNRIVIPSTDALSTETKPSTLAPTSTTRPESDGVPAQWSYERVIKSAPRVSNSQFQIGATTDHGAREDVSGYHFSSADREIRCSTGNDGTGALVCTSPEVKGPRQAPANEDSDCSWDRELAVLSGDGVTEGGCSNRHSVLFRSRSVPVGSAITVGRFACLSQRVGFYCVESGSSSGFALTDDGFDEIDASDRAPKSLTGVDVESTSTTSSSRVAIPR